MMGRGKHKEQSRNIDAEVKHKLVPTCVTKLTRYPWALTVT